jgi:hypothetical protein
LNEISHIENRKILDKFNKIKNWFSVKISKMTKLLARVMRERKRERESEREREREEIANI